MEIRDDRRYTTDHEWAQSVDGVVTIGITDYAQEQLGEVVYVELPEVGTVLAHGDVFGVVESTKSVSDLYAPVAGEVVEINESLMDIPEHVNNGPYEGGWMIKIQSDDSLDEMLNASDYESHVGS